jgi:hypothetical protein
MIKKDAFILRRGKLNIDFDTRFENMTNFLRFLYESKQGVKEDPDLHDDLDKNDIKEMKKNNLIRELRFQPKKTKVNF